MGSSNLAERILRIEAPHFTAGAIWRGKQCVSAAPILAWMVGADPARVRRWLDHKGYAWEWIKPESKP